jgi:hypothetical protein
VESASASHLNLSTACGIGHQVLVEEEYAFLQMLIVGAVCTDAVALQAMGATWWKVPCIVSIEVLHGAGYGEG